MRIRPAVEADVPALLPLMRALAVFERYVDVFAVTEETLREQGFRRSPPDFSCLVAEEDGGTLVGMLVFYVVPFTARAVPTLYVKELYVEPEARGRGVGERLMRAAVQEALAQGCGLVKWQVAEWNDGGRRFYERLGARPDPVWIDYALTPDAMRALTEAGE
jgi:GNAT superfamily N-acetyltransferase